MNKFPRYIYKQFIKPNLKEEKSPAEGIFGFFGRTTDPEIIAINRGLVDARSNLLRNKTVLDRIVG